MIFYRQKTWEVAQYECSKQGKTLVAVQDEDDNELLQTLMISVGKEYREFH